MNDQTIADVPPHVDRFLLEARTALAIMFRDGRQPVALKLRWKADDGAWGALERTYRKPSARKAVKP